MECCLYFAYDIYFTISFENEIYQNFYFFFMLKDKVESVSYDYELNMSDRFFINILNFFLLFHIEDNF